MIDTDKVRKHIKDLGYSKYNDLVLLKLCNEIDRLRKKNSIALDALISYANPLNWEDNRYCLGFEPGTWKAEGAIEKMKKIDDNWRFVQYAAKTTIKDND